MDRYVYIVLYNEGIVGAFSSYKKAQMLVEMYNKSSKSNEYNVSKIKIDNNEVF